MKTTMRFLATCTAVALPFATASFPVTASAQSPDAAYCSTLIKLYRSTVSTHEDPTVTVPAAMAKCHEGDTAAGIPVLEQALKDARVTLPSRG
jgi:hypothetical protein